MKHSSNSILAFTPQNKDGETILKQSLFFQQVLDKRIFVMDFIKFAPVLSKIFYKKTIIDIQEDALRKFQVYVQNTIQKEIPKEIILRVKPGEAVSSLIRESKHGGYDFIIVDKSTGSYDGALSNRDIDRFISKSHYPVLTINKDFPTNNVKKIVIPIDISQHTKKRLFWGTLFAKKFNAKIQIVSALNVNINEKNSLARRNADKIEAMLHHRGVDCDVKILKTHQQPNHKVLLDYMKEENPDLVIIRTHQEYRFSGRRIGKFVSEIVHGTTVPVFAVCGITQKYPEEIN
jgi:nucleotide-binding universal stress UspA family protein